MHEHPNLTNESMSGVVEDMAHKMASGDLTQALVSGNADKSRDHFDACKDCVVLNNVRNKYCFNVAYLDPKLGGPNYASLASKVPEELT